MNPIVQTLARTVASIVARDGRGASSVPVLEHQIEAAIERDPKLANSLNQESPLRSRVANGAGISVLGALAVMVPMVAPWFDWAVTEDDVLRIGGAVAVLFGAGYTLLGRFYRFATPMWGRLFGEH